MNGSILIPEKFRLKSELIHVVIDNEYCNEDEIYGEADFTLALITLCNRYKGKALKKSLKEKTFFHELVHMILDAMGQDELNKDEDFVDAFAELWYEFEKTKV